MFIWQVSQLPKQLNLNSHYLNKNGILNCRSKLGCAVVFYYLGTHRHTDTQTHRHTDSQTHRHTDTQLLFYKVGSAHK